MKNYDKKDATFYADVLNELAHLDPRIRMIKQELRAGFAERMANDPDLQNMDMKQLAGWIKDRQNDHSGLSYATDQEAYAAQVRANSLAMNKGEGLSKAEIASLSADERLAYCEGIVPHRFKNRKTPEQIKQAEERMKVPPEVRLAQANEEMAKKMADEAAAKRKLT